jgi:hypothetical protein
MSSTEADDYFDLRSEWYWKPREQFERSDIGIDPNDKELTKQLKIKWTVYLAEADDVGQPVLDLLEFFGAAAERIGQRGQRLGWCAVLLAVQAAGQR